MTNSGHRSDGFDRKLQTGLAALKQGAHLGAPIHYMDAALGEGMIRHYPDGTRQRLVRINGEYVVAETLEPGIAVEPR